MWDGLSDWWDRLELWLAQLWFPAQFVLIVAVLVPLCVGIAWLIDRLVVRSAVVLTNLRSRLARRKAERRS